MLKLQFSGRRTNQEADLGAFVRVNTSNGNIKISPSVISALGLKAKDKVNVICVEAGVAYLGQNSLGATLSPDNTTSSKTLSSNLKECFAEQMKDGDGVLVLSVDTDNVIPAEDGDGEEIHVVQLVFQSSQPSRGHKGSDDAEAVAEEATEPTEEAAEMV